jgi:membrane-anchored protein YejM (alkaline phosphatase superfamily)
LDLTIFTIFLFNIIITFVLNLDGTRTLKEGDRVVDWNEKAQIYCINYASNWVGETTILIFGLVLLWIRVINFIRYQEDLGRFVTVVKKLVSEIVLYFVLYIINLLTFATIAESAFRNL